LEQAPTPHQQQLSKSANLATVTMTTAPTRQQHSQNLAASANLATAPTWTEWQSDAMVIIE
jgi:hypothetical protein